MSDITKPDPDYERRVIENAAKWRAQQPKTDPRDAEIARLTMEVQRLEAENARLRAKDIYGEGGFRPMRLEQGDIRRHSINHHSVVQQLVPPDTTTGGLTITG